MPLPVTGSDVEEGWALLVNVRVALALPVVRGLNEMVKVWLWPAEIVNGSVNPTTAKALLFVAALVMVTLAPLAVKDPEAVPLLPTTTLPKFRLPGETAS